MLKLNKVPQVEAAKRAQTMRDQAFASAMKRKEEYIGARVPKELKDRVIKRAKTMEIPVSLLVRKVLEDAFGDGINIQQGKPNIGQPGELHRETSAQHESPLSQQFNHVVGWKSIELNQSQVCECCQASLTSGTHAFWGVTLNQSEYSIVCQQCKDQITPRN